jgi:methylated-DNA-[protein]-cysteine S-methyltransferase
VGGLRDILSMAISHSLELHRTYYLSKIGPVEIIGTKEGITTVAFVEQAILNDPEIPLCLKDCVGQLDAYFKGERKRFSVKLRLTGTDFDKVVWEHLARLPYGETKSYTEMAASIGNKNAVRAVGRANGRNKLAIILPCHRLVGSDGSLRGYVGGVWRKQWLLQHEKSNLTIR